jgi:riboflavin kinase/FMN adenylyltransferase
MKIYRSIPRHRTGRPLVLTIGVFDGVHRGHQAILRQVVRRARGIGGSAAAITFDRHPLQLVAPELAPPLLCTLEQKQACLSQAGLDLLFLLPFNRAMAGMAADRFIEEILVRRLGVAELVAGYDFAFGRQGLGSLGLLKQAARKHGFKLHVAKPLQMDGAPVSSTRVREAVLSGEMKDAARLLGRPYAFCGKVVHGEARGRLLGYPTANLRPDQGLLPRDGVWGGQARVLGDRKGPWLPFIADLGVRPTFGPGAERRLELHLLQGRPRLYGKSLEVRFLRWLRGEKRFADVQLLVAQVRRDELQYLDWIKGHLRRI